MVTKGFVIGELSLEFSHSKANPEKYRKGKKKVIKITFSSELHYSPKSVM